MSRKHNTNHRRSVSQYPARLSSRGESSASVRMPFIDRWGRKHDTADQMNRASPPRRGESVDHIDDAA